MDLSLLEEAYAGRNPYHGELHDHASTGGTSDGKRCLLHWRCAMEAMKMDFAAILDHKQVRHMFLPLWDETTFLCGTEPGTHIVDAGPLCTKDSIHYNMLFPTPEPLMELLEEFEEYKYTGGIEGHFCYPRFTRARMGQLIDAVKEKGGFFVHPHPKQCMHSEDPLDYYFRDETGLEVFYYSYEHPHTKENYKLWCDLLALGKRLWCCAGGDLHRCASNKALTSVYAEDKRCPTLLSHIKTGDFVCGPVGIRMVIGDTKMGGTGSFVGKTLQAVIDDFHPVVKIPANRYRLDLVDDQGVVTSVPFACTKPLEFSFRVEESARFYRFEIYDVTRDVLIALGNPIWNEAFYQ